MIKDQISIWFAKSKDGQLLMFTSEPRKTVTSWVGNFYVNSVIYENLKNMLNGTSFSFDDEPQFIQFKLAEP